MRPSFSSVAFSLALLGFAGSMRAQSPAAPTDLFNGKDLTGWSLVNSKNADIATVCHVTDDGVMAVAGKPIGYLLAAGTYSNYKLHVEWRWPANAVRNSNSGILIHIASGPVDRNTWPVCFQVQTKLNRGGDILPMAHATFAEPLSTAPGAANPQINRQNPSSEKPLGEWNACDVVCRDGTLDCTLNGVVQNHVTGCQPAAGQIGIQLEGFPYELRHIRIEPLP